MTSMQAADSIPGDLAARLADADAEVRRIAVMELPYSDEDDILPFLLKVLRNPKL